MSELTPTQVLRKARELMNDNGAHWIKGRLSRTLKNGEKSYCDLGGICEAAGVRRSQTPGRVGKDALPAIFALANAIREADGRPPVKNQAEALWTVYGYNDNPKITWRENARMIGRAATSARRYISMSPPKAMETVRKPFSWG